jgi:DNA-binding transcriptional LysR family regulator
MDLLQLEHFLAVVDEGSFTRAAERVCRTQSAVSQSIKKLEETIGAPLFARDMPEVCLTQTGKVLVEYARRLMRLRDDAMRSFGDLAHLTAGSLSIAAHEAAAIYLVPGPLKSYLQKFPDIKIGIYRSPLNEIPQRILDREVEIGFVKEKPNFHELKCLEVHCDETILVASSRHPFASRRRVYFRDLGEEHFVLHHLCAATTQRIMRLFEQHGTHCKVAAELWSFENVKHFVQEEVGLAIVPRITVTRELRDRVLVQIPLPELNIQRRTLMIYRDQGYLSDAAREWVDVVSSFNWSHWFSKCDRKPSPTASVHSH